MGRRAETLPGRLRSTQQRPTRGKPGLWPIIHEPGGGPNTQRRVRSGLRQIHTFPSGLGDASSNGTNSVSRTPQPLPVTATRSGDSQSLSPQHHSPTGFRYAPRLIQESCAAPGDIGARVQTSASPKIVIRLESRCALALMALLGNRVAGAEDM